MILTRIVQGILTAAALGLAAWVVHEAADRVTGSDGDRRQQDPATEAAEEDEDERAA